MSLSISKIVEDWGKTQSTSFGSKGMNVHINDRPSALLSLISKIKEEGYAYGDLLRYSVRIVDFCVPEAKQLRKQGWVYRVACDFFAASEEVFPGLETNKSAIQELVKNSCRKLGIKYTGDEKKLKDVVERRPSYSPIEDSEEEIPTVFSKIDQAVVDNVVKKSEKFLDQSVAEKMSELLKSAHRVSRDREDKEFEKPIADEIRELFGLDENGELL